MVSKKGKEGKEEVLVVEVEEKNLKNSGQKIQNENVKSLEKLNEHLKDLLFSAKEMEENGRRTGELIK